jgi:dolichyl-phosphate beta-glucosyltransferase
MIPDISIILPSYRAATLVHRSVDELRALFADEAAGSWEVIVVDDGGGDFEPDAYENDPAVRLLRFPRNRGKGAALRAGLQAARGRVRVMTDADLPYGTALIPVIRYYLLEHRYHLVVGDRQLPASSYLERVSKRRSWTSKLSALLIDRLLTRGSFDTQCGLKGIRGDVANAVADLTRIDRFAFDIELIFIALRHRMDVKRIPVLLREDNPSTVRLCRDAARCLGDLLKIRYNAWRDRYHCPALEEIVMRDFAQSHEAARSLRGVLGEAVESSLAQASAAPPKSPSTPS